MKRYIITLILLLFCGLCIGQQINRAEFYIGNDPGFGQAVPITISSSGEDVTLDFLADIQTLTEGFHCINIRACDDIGKWSLPVQRFFYVFNPQADTEKEIKYIEYFIDNDPGFGNGIAVNMTSKGNDLSLDFTADIQSLTEGLHFICIRTCDELGKWSLTVQRIFYVYNPQSDVNRKITSIEYFIDIDPGFGEATQVEVLLPGNDVGINFDVDLTSLSSGDHVLHIRGKDALNRWGQMHSQGFSLIITSVDQIRIEPWFKLYPNPSDGNFYLEFSKEQNNPIKLSIDDLNGKRVYEYEYHSRINLLNLNLQAGLYLLNVEQEDNRFTHKIIIK